MVCKNSYNCDRAITSEVIANYKKSGLPIAVYTDFPECFVRWFEEG
jgi:hypothetical protein